MAMDSNAETAASLLHPISGCRAVGSCLLLSVLYVASLYIWGSKESRDHPDKIKKRFFSVFVMMFISPLFTYFTSSQEFLDKYPLLFAMGLKYKGLLPALILPLLLTMILFLGPIFAQIFNRVWILYFQASYWTMNVRNLMWLRNHVVAPLSEEYTFRACMLPILVQSLQPSQAIYISPLFFGVAHFHHMIEHLRMGVPLKAAIITSCCQFAYTSIFGMYSAYLFLRTGHLVAPFIVHAFCNHMGFPDLQEVCSQRPVHKIVILVALYIVGLAAWLYLLPILTNPDWYSNDYYWSASSAVAV